MKLGLDALIAIDLKNWISREFHADIPSSEIQDHPSIIALANTIDSATKDLNRPNRPVTADDQKEAQFHGDSPYAVLPRLPLPDLDHTMQLYLKSRQHYLSSKELSELRIAIEEFLIDGGIGRKLQDRLKARWADP